MTTLKPDHVSPKEKNRLRNFDLSVDEIKLMRSIQQMKKSVSDMEQVDPQSSRLGFYYREIKKLEKQLEELRENTLIE